MITRLEINDIICPRCGIGMDARPQSQPVEHAHPRLVRVRHGNKARGRFGGGKQGHQMRHSGPEADDPDAHPGLLPAAAAAPSMGATAPGRHPGAGVRNGFVPELA